MSLIPIEMIVAYAHDRVIGRNNDLPWYVAEDLTHFKNMTEGHIVLMGRKTWESLPYKPLRNRTNIVLSSDPTFTIEDPNVIVVRSIEEFTDYLKSLEDNPDNLTNEFSNDNIKRAFIIGGGAVYAATLALVNKIHVTEIDLNVKGDTYFPVLSDRIWKVTSMTNMTSKTGIKFTWGTYQRF